MTSPKFIAMRDQVIASCADMSAEELIHEIAHLLRATIMARTDIHDDSTSPTITMLDTCVLICADAVAAWMRGPNHSCVKHRDATDKN